MKEGNFLLSIDLELAWSLGLVPITRGYSKSTYLYMILYKFYRGPRTMSDLDGQETFVDSCQSPLAAISSKLRCILCVILDSSRSFDHGG